MLVRMMHACNTKEEYDTDSKRLKGIGIGAPDGPISLDDVRSLQRSNTVTFIIYSEIHDFGFLTSIDEQFKHTGA